MRVPENCKAELVVTDKDGNETRQLSTNLKALTELFRDFTTLTNQSAALQEPALILHLI